MVTFSSFFLQINLLNLRYLVDKNSLGSITSLFFDRWCKLACNVFACYVYIDIIKSLVISYKV